jgi:hypothetical protein
MTATQLQQHTLSIADQINSHAIQATTKACEAVQHAIEAGKLLLEVKASLAHGQFGAWLAKHVSFSARQAQRYIAAAEGKPVPIRAPAKYDTVSHLTHEDAEAKAAREYFKPTWEPIPGHQMMTIQGDVTYWVTESLEHPGYFHFTKVCEPGMSASLGSCSLDTAPEDMDGNLQFSRRPCKSVGVEMMLGGFGLKDPAQQRWKITPIAGCVLAFGNVVLPPEQTPAADHAGG